MEDVEVVVRCIPTSVVFECPYCEEENEYDYSEFCDLCGHPSDWDYEILECQNAERSLKYKVKNGVENMNVLEKILEEIEEATFQEDAPIYIGNMEVDGYVRASRVKDIIRSHMNEKEKVTSAEIISRKTDGKPYYGIKYKKVGEDHYTVGYSSYYLDYVIDWLNNCFEFCGESKIVVNVGKDTNVPSNDGWIPVEERLPEDCEEIVLVQVSGKPADNILFDNAFEFALYEKEEGWMLDNYPEWKNPDVIAWQPLPEPYRRFKKELS